jgi:putative Ig domain-containing protein
MSPRSIGCSRRLDKPAFPVLNPKLLIASVLCVVLIGTAGASELRAIRSETRAAARESRATVQTVARITSSTETRLLTINTSLPRATSGAAYNAVIAVSGGTAPYQFSIFSGSLPSGLRLNATTGSISGIYQGTTSSGRFGIAVSDSARHSAQAWARILVGSSESGGISVLISPTSATVQAGGTQQFSAAVRNTSQSGVTWSASAGSITAGGLFTAPKVSNPTSVTVTATSVADATKKASATVAVATGTTPPPPPPSGSLTIVNSAIPGATTGSAYGATLSATGGQQPYQWSIVSGSLPGGLQLNATSGLISGTTSSQGQFSFTAQVKDAAAATSTKALTLVVSSQPSGSKFDGPAELPRVYIQSLLANTPAPGNTISVPAGGSLQTALNNANCGDTITLQAGATFPGVFTFPAKSCDDQHWIIVRTSAPDSALPPEGTRLTPCYAGVASLPGRPAFNCKSTQNVMAKLIYPGNTGKGPVIFDTGATHYRLIGLEITQQPGGLIVYGLITTNGPADHLVFDRLWVHGTPQDETKSGLQTSGTQYVAVVDSFFTDMHCISGVGACTDGNAIGGGNGQNPMGPYKIVNNFLESGGENIIFGGGAASQTPADIEIRRNHFFRPLTWLKGQPGFVGGPTGNPFSVKNNFELKNAQRVLFEANVLENSWGGFTQKGFSILLTPKNQTSGSGVGMCPTCKVTDITIRYCTISHAGAGMSIANGLQGSEAALDGQRYSIHDVIIDDIDPTMYVGSGNLIQVGNSPLPAPLLQNVSINHITGFTRKTFLIVGAKNPTPFRNFIFTNNLLVSGQYPIYSTGGTGNCANGKSPTAILSTCFNPYVFAGNAIYGSVTPFSASTFPPQNTVLSSIAAELVNYNSGNGGDYHLVSSSPLRNAGTDGKDVGADVPAVMSAVAGVR